MSQNMISSPIKAGGQMREGASVIVFVQVLGFLGLRLFV